MNAPFEEPLSENNINQFNSNKDINNSEENSDKKIELVSEELNISKKVDTHTRIFKKEVVEEQVNIPVELLQENIEIQRVPINMEVDSFPEIRHEGDVTIIPIVREEAVIVKKLILVEEIKLTKKSSTETQFVQDTVRKEVFNEDDHSTNNKL